jgi:predicted nucleic acid-binding protein
MKILLDTNVILDIVEKREPYFSDLSPDYSPAPAA